MTMKQDERSANQAKAEAALTIAVSNAVKEFDLTTPEICVALCVILSRWTQYQLRDERSEKTKDARQS